MQQMKTEKDKRDTLYADLIRYNYTSAGSSNKYKDEF